MGVDLTQYYAAIDSYSTMSGAAGLRKKKRMSAVNNLCD